jgi:hypothetical protein
VIGMETTIKPERDAELYVRVSDDPAWMGKHTGNVDVRIEAVATP